MKFTATKMVIFTRINGKLKFVRATGVMGLVDCPSEATDYNQGLMSIAEACSFFGIKRDKEGRYPYAEIKVEYTIDDALLAQLESED